MKAAKGGEETPAQAPRRPRLASCVLIALLLAPVGARADRGEEAAICDRAAARAAAGEGVPLAVMRAIMRTETGRRIGGETRPWPWTVNMEGEGRWFESRGAAMEFVRARRARGARSYDIGCFQINAHWHGEHFASLDEMFDPEANAAYAARFLRTLYAESGSWARAAGHYHSRTPRYADRYRKRFERILAGLDAAPVAPRPAPASSRPAPASAPVLVAVGGGAGGAPPRPGAVALGALPRGRGLLTPARPLF